MGEKESTHSTEPSEETAKTLDAIARVTGTAAHDFNNLLMTVMGYADLLHAQLPEGERLRNDAQAIVEATTRAGKLCRQLLAFSGRQQLRPKRFPLNDRLLKIKGQTDAALGPNIKLDLQLDTACGDILCDPSQFDWMVLEMAANAAHAIQATGSFAIITRAGEDHAVIQFADTGPGMCGEAFERAFEPFFTTKPKRIAQGMGLPCIYGFVRQSGGTILLSPRTSGGVIFEVRLPRPA
jgi:two-component system, cell cycle sensor histidine kinase and response regulator CckA